MIICSSWGVYFIGINTQIFRTQKTAAILSVKSERIAPKHLKRSILVVFFVIRQVILFCALIEWQKSLRIQRKRNN